MINPRKLVRSFGHALNGLATLVRTEQNARVHAVATVILIALAWHFRLSRIEIGLLFFAVVLVFAIEIINTAIERLLDLLHPHSHAEIGFIKDALAGAVLLAAVIALGIGLIVFWPHLRG